MAADPAFRLLEFPHPFTHQRLIPWNISPGCRPVRTQQGNEEEGMEWDTCCAALHSVEGRTEKGWSRLLSTDYQLCIPCASTSLDLHL